MKRWKLIRNAIFGMPLITMGLPHIIMKDKKRNMETQALKGHINHAVCRWPYQNIPFNDYV